MVKLLNQQVLGIKYGTNITISEVLIKNTSQNVKGMKINNNDSFDCAQCLLGKMHKNPIPKTASKSEYKLGELIHSDVWGPAPVETYDGYRYFVSFRDDKSDYIKIYLMKSKNETLKYFKYFKNEFELQMNLKIKILRYDFGSEFINKYFNEFLSENGIIYQRSAPNNHE